VDPEFGFFVFKELKFSLKGSRLLLELRSASWKSKKQ
jgi:hypothetical protein